MSTLQMILDTLLANPGLWWPVATGGMSLLFGLLAKKAPALHEILSSISFDVPRLLNGLRMLVRPGTPALPPVSKPE